MGRRSLGPWLAASVACLLAAPVVAQDSAAPSIPIALQDESPPALSPATEWQIQGEQGVRKVAHDHDVEMWSIALIGPAAILIIVTALGLTITIRSLRQDFRRERDLNGYWHHGAIARARHSRD